MGVFILCKQSFSRVDLDKDANEKKVIKLLRTILEALKKKMEHCL